LGVHVGDPPVNNFDKDQAPMSGHRVTDEDRAVTALLEAIADSVHSGGVRPKLTPKAMLEKLNINLVYDAVDSAWETHGFFDINEAVELLWEHLTEERENELADGALLTPEEVALARKEFCKGLAGQENGYSVYLYTLTDKHGRNICFTSTHGDGGILQFVNGPFESEEMAKESHRSDPDADEMTFIEWWRQARASNPGWRGPRLDGSDWHAFRQPRGE
jgi:hypothetical protein